MVDKSLIGGLQPPAGKFLHEDDASAGAVGFVARHDIGGTGLEAEPTMHAGVEAG